MKKIILLLAILSAMNANGQWVQTNGPERGFVYCFASSKDNIYAGTYGGGVFRSTNIGEKWFAVNNGQTNPDVNSLLYSDSHLFAGTSYSGVFKSSNNGESWIEVNNGLANLNIEVLNSQKEYIFAGTTSGIFLSTNNGSNWVARGLSNNTVKSIIFVDSTLFVGTYGNGVFCSTNKGLNWTAVNIGLTNLNIKSLATIGNYIFVATQYQVYRSINNGAYWTYLEIPSQNQLIVKENNIFALGNGGVLKSTNFGLNWTAFNNGIISYFTHAIYANKTNLFLGSEFGVQISSNNGENWIVKNDGLTNELVISLAASGPYIFAGTESNGIFRSSDNGLNWDTCGLPGKSIFALASSCTNLFAGTVLDGGIFLSTNFGESWTTVSNGLNNQVVLSLVIKGNCIFAGTEGGVFRSTNNGENWNLFNNGITYNMIYALAATRTNVFAGSNTQQGGIYRSSDDGQNWTPINSGLLNRFIRSILISGTNIYAGTYGGVFLSTNNGDNWTSIGLAGLTVYSLVNIGEDVIAGTNKGVYLFDGISKTWINRNQGFNLIPSVFCLIIENNKIIAGTSFQSVWRRTCSNIIGLDNNSEIIPSEISLSQNYPNPFNPISNIKYKISKSSNVRITVYDVRGKEVETLVNEKHSPGEYLVSFDGSALNSGVYFYKMETEGFSETKRMMFIK